MGGQHRAPLVQNEATRKWEMDCDGLTRRRRNGGHERYTGGMMSSGGTASCGSYLAGSRRRENAIYSDHPSHPGMRDESSGMGQKR